MFSSDHTCSECAYMGTVDNGKGKFPCEKGNRSGSLADSKGYVYADSYSRGCEYRCEARIDSLGQSIRREKSRDARNHGYYVITAITKILGLEEDNIYMSTFKYIRDVVMPSDSQYEYLISDYEINGPILADTLMNASNSVDLSEYLVDTYLDDFVDLVENGFNEEAVLTYTNMLTILKIRLSAETKEVKMRRLV